MAKLTLSDITAGTTSTNTLNNNNTLIETELQNKVLYRNNPVGEPNQMENDLDMNSNRILNLQDAISASEPATFGQLSAVILSGGGVAGLTEGSVMFANASGNYAEDNVNLFWDDTNKRLGIGTNTPTTELDMGGGTIANVADPTNPQDAATMNYVDVEIAAATPSLTTGAVGYGVGGTLSGDTSKLYFDAANNRLSIASGTSPRGIVEVDTGATSTPTLLDYEVARGANLSPPTPEAGGLFAGSTDLNYDGSILAVGDSRYDDGFTNEGRVCIYDWTGTAWNLRGFISNPDPKTSDYFGTRVALNDDGTKLYIGSFDGVGEQGRVFEYTWGGASWTNTATITPAIRASNRFGSGLDISGNVLAVGAANYDGAYVGVGTIYFFDWNGSSWVERAQRLDPPDANHVDDGRFGYDIALAANGTILYTPMIDNDNTTGRGPWYRFSYSGGVWSIDQTLNGAFALGSYEYPGISVACSNDGNIVAAAWAQYMPLGYTADGDTFASPTGHTSLSNGGVSIFEWNGSSLTWKMGFSDNPTANDDNFGVGVAVSGNGLYLTCGHNKYDGGLTDEGRALSYQIAAPGPLAEFAGLAKGTAPSYLLETPGTAVNWRFGANSQGDAAFEIAVGTGNTDATASTYTNAFEISNAGIVKGVNGFDANSQKITSVLDPTAAQDAATKAYADTMLPLAGGTMTGAIAMGTNKITGLGTPTVSTDAATAAYADLKLPLAGGTMSGNIAMGSNYITGLADPVNPQDAATRAYVLANPPTIGAGSIGQTEIGSGAVHQDELDTTLGEVSSNVPGTQKVAVVLPGGTHGFYPQVKFGSDPAVVLGTLIYNADANPHPSTYTTYISFNNNDASAVLMYAQQRYVNASPPYDLGDGGIPLFVFVKVSGNTVAAVYTADVPPWAYNGPTNVSGKLKADGKKYQLKRTLNQDTGEVTVAEVEVTHAIKNADMPLIPHPFADMKAGDRVLMLDPVGTEALLEMQRTGESVCGLINSDYIRFDNAPLNRFTPPGVMAVDFTWRNTGKKPVGRRPQQ